MATVSVFMPNLSGTTGLTLFLRKSSDYSLVNTDGDALTESSTSGWFTATVAESWTETLSATVVDSDSLVPFAGWLGVGATVVSDVVAVLDSATQTQIDSIEDSIAAYIAGIAASASLTPGTIVGFPETLNIGDSYTDDCDSAIHVFIRDENDDPITAVGTHDFTDGDFAPECIITLNGNTGRVKCEVEYVTASPENYLKIQIPSKESRRATPGIATVQVLLKWDGAQKALSKQTVTWEGLI